MSRTLLVGPAGCGKTHRMLDEFERLLGRERDPLEESCLCILPSAEHTERVIRLILARGLKGFFHRRVTTLSRFLQDVFGMGEERLVSSVTRFMFLADILAQNEWDYFSGVPKSAGFLQAVASFLAELKESLVSVADFRERMNALKKVEPATAAKYEALAAIYEAYEAKLKAEGLLERQDALALYRERKEKGLARKVHFKHIWLDGFFDFSNLQLTYLKELAAVTDHMTVSLTKDPGRRRQDLFEAASRTEEALLAMDFKIEGLKPVSYRTQVPALVFLERQLFSDEGRQPLTPASPAGRPPSPLRGEGWGEGIPITIFEAVGVQGEVEMIAREIETLMRRGRYRYSDFAVLLRRIGSYEAVVRSIFARFEIPVEIHERERLEHAPMIQTLVSLLKILRNGWRRPDLIHFFKSCYVTRLGTVARDYEWASELEHRAFREGVVQGREEWLRPWTGQPGDLGLDEFNEEKRKGMEALSHLDDAFRASRRFAEIKARLLEAVKKTFGILQVRDSLSESVRRDGASARRLEAILEEIRMHFERGGAGEVTFEAFADQFIRLVELDLYSLHERDKNRVQVYDVSLARQKEYRVVFVAGLLEKSFPLQVREDPLLSDWERRIVNAHAPSTLRERLPRQNIERYLFYLAVTRASEKLFLTCPRLNLEGRESLPSFYLDEVRSLFGGALPEKRQRLSRPYPGLREAVTRRELETAIVGSLWDTDLEPKEEAPLLACVTARLLEEDSFRSKMRRAVYEITAELTDPAIREGDYFRARETSPTRLEEYAKCPYKYFAGQVLGLKDPNEEINLKLKGIILHEVLERYFNDWGKAGPDLFEKEKAFAFVLKELEAATGRHPLVAEKRYQLALDHAELEEMLGRFLEVELERLKTASLEPTRFEFGFGKKKTDQAPPLEITDGERKIFISGKIDRIDTDKDGRYGLVIDYKRSAQFKREELEIGTALQLPLYLAAIEKFLKLKPVGGELYSLRERKKRGFYHGGNAARFPDLPPRAQRLSEEEFSKTLERSLHYVRRFTRGMENLEIPVKPRLCEAHCPFPSLCRIEKWRLPSILEEIKEEDRKVMPK